MKKILQISLISILLLSFLMVPQSTYASTVYEEDLEVYESNYTDSSIEPYNWEIDKLAKKEVPLICGTYARTPNNYIAMIPGTQINNEEPLTSIKEDTTLFPSEELEDSIAPLSSAVTSEIRSSSQGSRVVMPAVNPYYNYGYCHIFERHMANANGTKKYDKNGASQFMYARFSASTMDVIMEAINGTTNLVTEQDGKYSKTAWSKTEQQNVKVILRRGSDMTGYSAYDWVVITAYPYF
ncbi:hypothetical protein ACQKNX_05090 [Lysinibacillus sp. NPDC093712]|uniref:hypothetical protein n=1 Tax=Lysinibacillus sp. NPDC093712 TaxID=3390579 RepID=UPI003D08B3C4